MIDTVIVEVPNPGHPLGVRGVGEVSLVPPMAAIGNAIAKATGARLERLPMNPGRCWRRCGGMAAADVAKPANGKSGLHSRFCHVIIHQRVRRKPPSPLPDGWRIVENPLC